MTSKPQQIFFDLGESTNMNRLQLNMLLYNLKSRTLPTLQEAKSLSYLLMSLTMLWLLTLSVMRQSISDTTVPAISVKLASFDNATTVDVWSFCLAMLAMLLSCLSLSWLDECVFGLMHIIAASPTTAAIDVASSTISIQGFDHQVARKMRRGIVVVYHLANLSNMLSLVIFMAAFGLGLAANSASSSAMIVAVIITAVAAVLLMSPQNKLTDVMFGRHQAHFEGIAASSAVTN